MADIAYLDYLRAVRNRLGEHEVRLLKGLGQHLLVDGSVALAAVEAAELTPGDGVLEVGAGPGNLTRLLLERSSRVLAFEKDRRMAALAQSLLLGEGRLELVTEDVLRSKNELHPRVFEAFREWRCEGLGAKMVSNLPYQIAGPLLACLLESEERPDRFVVMVQKEVGDRLLARPGSGAYGPLSVICALHARAERLRRVPPGAFRPSPKVTSMLIRMRVDPSLRRRVGRYGLFKKIVQTGFQHRRKQLRNALSGVVTGLEREVVEAALAGAGISGRRRIEEVGPEGLIRLEEELGTRLELARDADGEKGPGG